MYYCKHCQELISGEDLETKEICFEQEFGVDNLFQDRHYHTIYMCPYCHDNEDLEEAMKCDICEEYYSQDDLTDTTEYINGGVGYCCEGCMQDADMRAI